MPIPWDVNRLISAKRISDSFFDKLAVGSSRMSTRAFWEMALAISVSCQYAVLNRSTEALGLIGSWKVSKIFSVSRSMASSSINPRALRGSWLRKMLRGTDNVGTRLNS